MSILRDSRSDRRLLTKAENAQRSTFTAKMKAIVLTCDRYRAVTEHMMLQYEKLWPDHPFTFRIPFQELGGGNSKRIELLRTPPEIRPAVLELLRDLPDEEWIYWCVDDKYPVRLVLDKIVDLMDDALRSSDMDGLLFCRAKALKRRPEETLFPDERANSFGEIYLERKGWHQIWIHQLLKVKVVRYLFSQLPEQIKSAKLMDELKDEDPKLPEHRLFVTKNNFPMFGQSTHKGTINRNCYKSIRKTNIKLPEWFRKPNDKTVIIGKL